MTSYFLPLSVPWTQTSLSSSWEGMTFRNVQKAEGEAGSCWDTNTG